MGLLCECRVQFVVLAARTDQSRYNLHRGRPHGTALENIRIRKHVGVGCGLSLECLERVHWENEINSLRYLDLHHEYLVHHDAGSRLRDSVVIVALLSTQRGELRQRVPDQHTQRKGR